MRGSRDAMTTEESPASARPRSASRTSDAPTSAVPWVMSTTARTRTSSTSPAVTATVPVVAAAGRSRPTTDLLMTATARYFFVRASTRESAYASIERGPPNIQTPSGSRCTLPSSTNGSDFQTAFFERLSANASPSTSLAM